MLELLDLVVIALITFFGGLSTLFVAFKMAKPRLLKSLRGEAMNIGNQVSKGLAETIENVDLGDVMGQLGGGEGEGNPLAAIGGLLGGKGGGIGDIISLIAQLGGKKQEGGGSSGW